MLLTNLFIAAGGCKAIGDKWYVDLEHSFYSFTLKNLLPSFSFAQFLRIETHGPVVASGNGQEADYKLLPGGPSNEAKNMEEPTVRSIKDLV